MPLARCHEAAVAQSARVQAYLTVADEEAAVLGVSEVVLIEWGVTAEVFRAYVHEQCVCAETCGFEVCGHQEAGVHWNGDSSISFSRTAHRNNRQVLEIGDSHFAFGMSSALKGADASAGQEVIGIVEGPPADRFWHWSILGECLEGRRQRNRLVVPRVVGNHFCCVFCAFSQSFDSTGELLRHVRHEVELREDEGAIDFFPVFKHPNLITEDAFVVGSLRKGNSDVCRVEIKLQLSTFVKRRSGQTVA